MDKKELPDTKGDFSPKGLSAPDKSSKIAWVANKTFGLVKFILGIFLLAFVYSTTVAYLGEFGLVNKYLQRCFWSGVISLLIVYFFVWEPAILYAKGQRIMELVFSLVKPLVRVAPYLLPIYVVILFALYGILSFFVSSAWLLEYTIFLSGFTLSLHLIFSAKTVRGKKGDFLKANYIFGFSFVYILNLILLALFLNIVFKEFSFVRFCNNSYSIAQDIFHLLFRQFFVPGSRH